MTKPKTFTRATRGKGSTWGAEMSTRGDILVTADATRAAFEAAGHARAYRPGDEAWLTEQVRWYRLYAEGAQGASERAITKNLSKLVQRLDRALEFVFEEDGSFLPAEAIPDRLRLPLQLPWVIGSELADERLALAWRAAEAFGARDILVQEAVRRSVHAVVYLREVARLAGKRRAAQPKSGGLRPGHALVLRMIVLFEYRTGRPATVIFDPIKETRHSVAGLFVRAILRSCVDHLRGRLAGERGADRERHARLARDLADRERAAAEFEALCGGNRIEHLIDRVNRPRSANDRQIAQARKAHLKALATRDRRNGKRTG